MAAPSMRGEERKSEGGPPSTSACPPPHPSAASIPPPAHQTDADEDDENVKQLGDCSALYLALQECLVRTDRDWRSCQPGISPLPTYIGLAGCEDRGGGSSGCEGDGGGRRVCFQIFFPSPFCPMSYSGKPLCFACLRLRLSLWQMGLLGRRWR
ncbi:hypothetical protein Taro_008635 [Colocasia esculenta]|uniref:Uncharacterized protein n=1 Tax=Colocasia esculenta TaxID=4460 RepID=A0A843U3I9_COLES|nr:hypothetical protein [Colocasia esculenta]